MSAPLHPHDELAAYAVDALDPDERAAVEAHLDGCAPCRAELAEHWETLARVVDDESPPPWLWDQIAVEVRSVTARSEPAAGVAAVAAVRPRHLRRGPRRRVATVLAAAVAAVAAAVLVAVVGDLVGDDAAEVSTPADLPVGVVAAEDGTTVARLGADETGSYVAFADAVALGPDRTYQLWSLDGSQPVSLGVLGPGAGGDVVRVSLPPTTSAVAISDEPAGGSTAPTGPIVGTGELALPD